MLVAPPPRAVKLKEKNDELRKDTRQELRYYIRMIVSENSYLEES